VRLEAVSAEALIASEHVHRYRLAASLCEGMRVVDLACASGYGSAILRETAPVVLGIDNDAATIDMADVVVGAEKDVGFETADALEFLGRDLSDGYDAIVCFEGLEHFSDRAAALEAMARHAAAGMRLVVSLPNDGDRGYEDALSAVERFDEVTVLYQFLAEGSLIRGDEPSEISATVVLQEHGEIEWANYFIACVNLDERLRELGDSAQMKLVAAPHYNRQIRSLERANRELWRENTRIGRERIGTGGSAAVMAGERVKNLEQRVRDLERVLAAPRHRLVDQIRERIRRRSLLDRAARSLGTWLGRN
jgi:SAM-dependent methyltransferase